jgi:hypothetical protein
MDSRVRGTDAVPLDDFSTRDFRAHVLTVSEHGLQVLDPSRFRTAKVDPLLLETLQKHWCAVVVWPGAAFS